MPWEKSFDINATLTRAMEAFWVHGYEATSMQDLVKATGINRASIYATYGDKRSLFLAALKKYDEDVRGRLLAQLSRLADPRAAIAGVFDRFIEQASEPGRNWGCLITNTALELAAHDPQIADMITGAQREMEAFFLMMIEKGRAMGLFGSELSSPELARQTLAALLGMLVLLRSHPAPSYLTPIRDSALKILG